MSSTPKTPAAAHKYSRVPRRAPRACQQCRVAKVRCSGTHPCTRCTRRRGQCVFPEDDPKIAVSERYLLRLEQQAARSIREGFTVEGDAATATDANGSPAKSLDGTNVKWPSPESESAPSKTANGANNDDDDSSSNPVFTNNPLVRDEPFLKDPAGRHFFMGPTSMWSFVRRLLVKVDQVFPRPTETPRDPFYSDGVAMKLVWDPIRRDEKPNLADIPFYDFATYLFHTAKFRLGNLGLLIDQPTFLMRLAEFAEEPERVAQEHRLWLAEYFLVMAFGEAFIARNAKRSTQTLAGSDFASRALSLIPSSDQLHENGLLSIEVLALAALYLHCIDMRASAIQYIGQALRLAFVEGIYRELPPDIFSKSVRRRCRDLWWAVYIIDRRLTTSMGMPSSVRDEDINASLPEDDSVMALTTTLSIKLSRLQARIVCNVYGDGSLNKSYVGHMKTIIEDLAKVAQEGDAILMEWGPYAKENSQGNRSPPKMVSSVTLMYHHCILQAIRPLSMCLMKAFLDEPSPGHMDRSIVSAPIMLLLKTSVASAYATLSILRAMKDEDLLESFVPFDLECAFSAIVFLCVINVVLPELISDDSWHGTAQMILDTMVAQGSVVGRVRRAEFIALEEILGPLAKLAANDVAANGVTYAQQHQHQHMQHPTTQQQHQHYQHHHHHPSDSVESMGNGGTSEVGANGYHHSPNGGHSFPRGHHQHHVSSSHNGGGSSMSPHDAALGAVHSPGADDHIQAGGLDAWDPALDAASMNPDPSFLFDLALQFRPDSEMDIIGHL